MVFALRLQGELPAVRHGSRTVIQSGGCFWSQAAKPVVSATMIGTDPIQTLSQRTRSGDTASLASIWILQEMAGSLCHNADGGLSRGSTIVGLNLDADLSTWNLRVRCMESLIQFLDDAEDVIVSMALDLRRKLARRPRERRRVVRLSETSRKPSATFGQQKRPSKSA